MPKKIGNLRPLPKKFSPPHLQNGGDEMGGVKIGNSNFSSCDRNATQPPLAIDHYCSLPSEVGRFTLKKFTVHH